MVVRDYAKCNVCGTKLILRAGIGLEKLCLHSFDCPHCHSPLTVAARTGEPPEAWLEPGENISRIEDEDTTAVCINLHPSCAFSLKDFHDPRTFASLVYMNVIGRFMRVPSGSKSASAVTEFEVPNTGALWQVVASVLSLAMKRDPAGVLGTQIKSYTDARRETLPGFMCSTPFKCVASFFDDIFYPAFGDLRSPIKALISQQTAAHPAEIARFKAYYLSDLERPNVERYLATFNDYFRNFDTFRQMLAYTRVGSQTVDDLVVGSKLFDEIKLYYGQAYEALTSSFVTLGALFNIGSGRPFDQFASMSLSKYVNDVEKAKRSAPFKGVPELTAFTLFEDSSLRNGSHHASIWRDGEIVRYRSGGTGAERDISYSRYLHMCNGITIALAALFVIELQFFSKLATS